MKIIREKLSSNSLKERVGWAVILFSIIFFGTTILSFYLLPEGLMKNKNPLQSWETSKNSLILTLQIFFFNQLSVLVILLCNLIGSKKEWEDNYLSLGFLAFFTMIFINGIVLGTWSFSVESTPIPLPGRLLRTFDLIHRAGLWEMMGQLLIVCSTAHIAIVLTSGKNTVIKKLKDIHLKKSEGIVMLIGFVFMLIGAVVESLAINIH